MAATSSVTFRIDSKLFAALKAHARAEGTTVSAALVKLVEKHVKPPRTRKRRKVMGMFAGQFEDLSLEEFKQARREASALLMASIRRRWP
jgi:hypothetical protein